MSTRWLKYTRTNEKVPIPEYQTEGSAGFDLHAMIDQPLIMYSGQIHLIKTGISIELPSEMFEGQVRPRSGLSCRYGVTVVNAPGTIDFDFRSEIKVGLINLGKSLYTIQPWKG